MFYYSVMAMLKVHTSNLHLVQRIASASDTDMTAGEATEPLRGTIRYGRFFVVAAMALNDAVRRKFRTRLRGIASPARAKLLNEAVLENRSYAVGQSSHARI